MRRNWITLGIFFSITAIALIFTRNDRPLLGLDLQGGVAVVLQPVGDPPTASIEQAKNIINQRVDALGVAEPDIVRQGNTIVVQLPGVRDREQALDVIGRTARLEFRPVLEPSASGFAFDTELQAQGENPCVPAEAAAPPEDSEDPATTEPGGADAEPADDGESPPADGTDEVPVSDTEAPASDGDVEVDEEGASFAPPADGESAAGLPRQADTTAVPATTAAGDDPETTAPAAGEPGGTTAPTEPTATSEDDRPVVYPERDRNNCMALGPLGFEGKGLSSADAELIQGQWQVTVKVRDDSKQAANAMFNACYAKAPTCPDGMTAIVLDRVVQSAPVSQGQNLADSAQGFQISGDFSQREAKDLALVLKYGALPVEFKPDVNVQEVSATLGEESLRAGLISGLVGLLLVVLYMVVYYRALGLVAVVSLLSAGALLWVVIAYMGETRGLALTLAGVTGIIISVGVAVDSNVVFYEHLREDIAKGRTFRSVVTASFESAWRTIIAADLVSLIGAGLLYFLTVGAVRGFAFYLGLSTMLDLLASYFVMRPLVLIMSRQQWLIDRPRLLGLQKPATRQGGAS